MWAIALSALLTLGGGAGLVVTMDTGPAGAAVACGVACFAGFAACVGLISGTRWGAQANDDAVDHASKNSEAERCIAMA